MLTDLRESGSLEQDADVVLLYTVRKCTPRTTRIGRGAIRRGRVICKASARANRPDQLNVPQGIYPLRGTRMNPALHTTCPLPRMSLPASDDSIADEESQRIDAKVEDFSPSLAKGRSV